MFSTVGTRSSARFAPRCATAASAAVSVSGAYCSSIRMTSAARIASILNRDVLERRRLRDVQSDRFYFRRGRRELHPDGLRLAGLHMLVPAVVPVRVQRRDVCVLLVLQRFVFFSTGGVDQIDLTVVDVDFRILRALIREANFRRQRVPLATKLRHLGGDAGPVRLLRCERAGRWDGRYRRRATTVPWRYSPNAG